MLNLLGGVDVPQPPPDVVPMPPPPPSPDLPPEIIEPPSPGEESDPPIPGELPPVREPDAPTETLQ